MLRTASLLARSGGAVARAGRCTSSRLQPGGDGGHHQVSRTSEVSRFAEVSRRRLTTSARRSSALPHEQPTQLKPLEEAPDENFDYPLIDLPRQIQLRPLSYQGLQLQAVQVEKNGSFLANLFVGEFDVDFLKYPNVMPSRAEFNALRRQHEMVRQHFNRLLGQPNCAEILAKLGFQNLWLLSRTQMVNVFEAIGASFARPYQANAQCTAVAETEEADAEDKPDTSNNLLLAGSQQLLVQMMLQNLCGSASAMADNKKLGEQLKQIMLSGKKVGFAWCEKEAKLGSVAYNDWRSEASLNEDKTEWTLSGEKSHLRKDNYDYYLLFCRTKHYPEDDRPLHSLKPEDTNPGIVTFLVPRNLVQVIDEEPAENGAQALFQYQRIRFDQLVLPREAHELFEAEEYGALALSARAIGHLNSAALLLGMMKGLLKELYEHLRTNRLPVLDCELVEARLCDLTNHVYTVESMLYLSSAMYDCFKLDSWPDMSLEANATKILAVEYARDFVNSVQSLFGAHMLQTAQFHDLINLLDSFLDTATHHRLMMALIGQHMVGQYKHENVQKLNLSPFYVSNLWKWMSKNRKQRQDIPELELHLRGHVHPSLQDQADQLEYCAKRLEYAAELTLIRHTKRTASKQMDLYRLSRLACDLYAMTAVVSRASRAYTETLQNAETEVHTATVITQKLWLNVREVVYELERSGDRTPEVYHKEIHDKNLKFGGYFAYSPLDKVHY